MINTNNAVGEEIFTCIIKCPKCSMVIAEASNIPESEKGLAFLSLSNSKVITSHLQSCGVTAIDFEWVTP